jgi:hypothetical protein
MEEWLAQFIGLSPSKANKNIILYRDRIKEEEGGREGGVTLMSVLVEERDVKKGKRKKEGESSQEGEREGGREGWREGRGNVRRRRDEW